MNRRIKRNRNFDYKKNRCQSFKLDGDIEVRVNKKLGTVNVIKTDINLRPTVLTIVGKDLEIYDTWESEAG